LPASRHAPFGSFDTPTTNTTGVVGAIAVTGWALDNIEVTRVDISREPIAGETCRPGCPGYGGVREPMRGRTYKLCSRLIQSISRRWGYQMLTNFLPNASGSGAPGNGTYKLHATAFNKAGGQLDLGIKTITVDNAHATKPFGTIDTTWTRRHDLRRRWRNFGWALTTPPAMIAH